MQLSLAGLVLLLSLQVVHSLSLSISRSESKFYTLPLRRMEQRSDIHPQILLQMRINRGIRRLATMTSVKPPSAEDLQKRLEKRVFSVDAATEFGKRYNRIRGTPDTRGLGAAKLRRKRQAASVTPADSPSTLNSLGLDIEAADDAYLATISMGTPPQNFLILMDSGSADFWVGSETCATEGRPANGCGNHTFLGSLSSSSFVATSGTFNTTYGKGNVVGNIVMDNVEIAGLSLTNHTFGVANQETENFASSETPFDGLMGLAHSSLSTQQTPTPIEALASAGLLKEPIVSYKLGRLADNKNDGEITFGALDSSKFDPNALVNLQNVNTLGFWEASLDSVSVNGADLGLIGRTTILDTGTTLMILPEADANAIHAKIPGAESDNEGGFTLPCSTNASVALTYGGQMFTIDPRDLVTQPPVSDGTCASGIAAGSISKNQKEWLVGDVFLKNAYFSTNVASNNISLAKLV